MSRLLRFYRGEDADSEGRLIHEIWAWDDVELEMVHDFIQWLFPLAEPSAFNRDAPILTDDDVTAFQTDPLLRANLLRSLERMLAFFGLAQNEQGEVVDGPNFAARAPDIWEESNHNWLRITRILHSLTILGLPDRANSFFAWLEAASHAQRFPIDDETFAYWSAAIKAA